MKFNVTYETITPDSAARGDFADNGFLAEQVSLRDALDAIDGRGCHVEADCCPVSVNAPPRWLTFYNVQESFETGEHENRALHFPETITPSSAMRIARLVECYGVERTVETTRPEVAWFDIGGAQA